MTILYAWVWSGSLRLTWVKLNRDWIMSPSIWRTCGAEGHTLAQGRNNMQTSILSSYCTVDHLSSLSCTSISIEIIFCSPRQHKEWKEQLESQWERKTTSLRSETDETEWKERDKRSDDPLYKCFEMMELLLIFKLGENERKLRNRKLWPGSDCFHSRQ